MSKNPLSPLSQSASVLHYGNHHHCWVGFGPPREYCNTTPPMHVIMWLYAPCGSAREDFKNFNTLASLCPSYSIKYSISMQSVLSSFFLFAQKSVWLWAIKFFTHLPLPSYSHIFSLLQAWACPNPGVCEITDTTAINLLQNHDLSTKFHSYTTKKTESDCPLPEVPTLSLVECIPLNNWQNTPNTSRAVHCTITVTAVR